jgi:hypothetical protein
MMCSPLPIARHQSAVATRGHRSANLSYSGLQCGTNVAKWQTAGAGVPQCLGCWYGCGALQRFDYMHATWLDGHVTHAV